MLEQEVYGKYSYQPQINKISKELAKGGDLYELAYNKKGAEKKDQLQEMYQTKDQ